MEIKMFDVLQVRFNEEVGSVQNSERPCVVIQNDIGNKYSPTTIVIPTSSNIKKIHMPTHEVLHRTEENGLSKDSMLLGEQVRVIDKQSIVYKRGKLSTDKEKNLVMQVFFANATGKRASN